jgi:hypothetical protein
MHHRTPTASFAMRHQDADRVVRDALTQRVVLRSAALEPLAAELDDAGAFRAQIDTSRRSASLPVAANASAAA